MDNTDKNISEFIEWEMRNYPNLTLTLINIELILEFTMIIPIVLFLIGFVSIFAPIAQFGILVLSYTLTRVMNIFMVYKYKKENEY